MCGICGYINLDGSPASAEIIGKMNRALQHRGPDDEGMLLEGSVALAMRRLAIIDVEGGHQPISNEDASVWTVFNGEIYNAFALREELEAAGHHFSTHTDTEVIVHAYEADPDRYLSRLRGMYAFALLDKRAISPGGIPKVTLVRDRFGIKPLYYYHDERVLAFSSELTSLVQHPSIPRQVDIQALHQYLSTGIVASPATMFKGIRQLMPAQAMTIENGTVSLHAYWQLPDAAEAPPCVEEASLRVRELLEESVREHLLSDVPVGAFLSGGIDSSTVVAMMAKSSAASIPTFSIRFEDGAYDESRYARLVAQRFGTDHHEFTVANRSFDASLLEAMISHHGQPTADSSALPTFIVSSLAREYVKVAMSGDGGDEAFAGYSHYGWLLKIKHLYRLPNALKRSIRHALMRLAVSGGRAQGHRLRQLINALDVAMKPAHAMPYEVLRINSDVELQAMLTPAWQTADTEAEGELLAFLCEQATGDLVADAQRFSFRFFLPDAYLPKVDRMSMAASLEVRVPFLDHRLVEYALSLPGHMHVHGGIGKQVLRRAVSDLLPQEVMSHRKQGFSIPLHSWATDDYYALAESLLNEDAVRARGIFDPTYVRNLLDRCRGRGVHHRALESDYRLSHRLFMLVVFELWCRMYIDDLIDSPSAAVLDGVR